MSAQRIDARVWAGVHGLERRARALLGRLRRRAAPRREAERPVQGDRLLDREFSHQRNRLPLPPPLPTGEAPRRLVSIIVLNRDGAAHLEAFFRSFAQHNSYEAVELLIVDHGSRDASRSVIERWSRELPLVLLACEENHSYSYSNNRAAERARGELLLFANNDLIFTEDVIPEMVALLGTQGVGAVGIRLDFPPEHPDYPGKLQHVGIKFDFDPVHGFQRPYNVGVGVGLEDSPSQPERFPAVTAALMLCERSSFLSLGGFDEAYLYGYEDVDLGLRFWFQRREASATVTWRHCLHNESATRRRELGPSALSRQRRNQLRYAQTWGYRMRREVLEDRMRSGSWYGDGPLTVGLAVTQAGAQSPYGDTFTALELGCALEQEGSCRVRHIGRDDDWYDAEGLDVLIALLDDFDPRRIQRRKPGLVTIAWCRNWFDRWVARGGFQAFDLVACSSKRAAEFVRGESHKAVRVLPLATSWDPFASAQPLPEYRSDVCFTGSRWGEPRDLEIALRQGGMKADFAIYGRGWEDVPQVAPYLRGFVPYARMPAVYASTRIVVDDANRVTRPWGSVNSRVFDALAAGRLVVSNGERGAAEIFGGALPVYEDADTLRVQLEGYLEDPVRYEVAVEHLRAEVREKHTYRHRARSILEWLGAWAAHPARVGIQIPLTGPEWEQRPSVQSWANTLKALLDARGYHARLVLQPSWHTPAANGDDVIIALTGRAVCAPKPDQIGFLWLVDGAPESAYAECVRFDCTLGTSEQIRRWCSPAAVASMVIDPAANPLRIRDGVLSAVIPESVTALEETVSLFDRALREIHHSRLLISPLSGLEC